jgi:hypothetical protein
MAANVTKRLWEMSYMLTRWKLGKIHNYLGSNFATRAPDDFGATHEKGIYGFLQLPEAGDRIQILNARGLIDFLKVYTSSTPR